MSLLLSSGCVDPVEPEFEYVLGIPFIDAVLGTSEGTSYVQISESAREFGVNLNKPVTGANVYFINDATGARVALSEQDLVYVPPEDFMARVGETWELEVQMPGGKLFRSEPEKIPEAVSVDKLDVRFDTRLYFSDDFDAFIPGHRMSVDFSDPPGTDNFYYWRFRSFEKLVNCRTCFGKTLLRNGECIVINQDSEINLLKDYYTYACDQPCWQVRYSDKISIFSDEFSQGQKVSSLAVGDIVYYTRRDILVQLQQFSVSAAAYRYLKTLKDLIDNNSGFNAPLPAALVGNLYNPSDSEEIVLGRFTAASTTVTPIFINRSGMELEPLEPVLTTQVEGEEVPPPLVLTSPCVSSRYRTNVEPIGWQN